jgi:acetyl esterase
MGTTIGKSEGNRQPRQRDGRSWLAKLLGESFRGGPPITSVEMIPERRKAIDLSSINTGLPELAEMRTDVLLRERDGHRLTAEIYVPKGDGPFPTVVFFHGGAWCVWKPADVRRIATRVAAAGHVVVNVDYGLAPEHRYPWAVEDAVYATRWAARNAPSFGGDGGPVALAGDSAGATLSCGVISFLDGVRGTSDLDEGDLAGEAVDISAALLLYGVYDFAARMHERDTTPGTNEIMFNLAYLGTVFTPRHRDPLVSPIYAPDLDRYPPVYLSCGTDDALLPQSLAMTRAFAEAGASTTLSVVPDVDHEFLMLDPTRPDVAAEWRRSLTWLASHTGARHVEDALEGMQPRAMA